MYIIFGGERYYASGGGNDFLDKKKSLAAAIDVAKDLVGKYAVTEICDWSDDRNDDNGYNIEWTHVFDTNTGAVVHKSERNPHGCDQAIEIREE